MIKRRGPEPTVVGAKTDIGNMVRDMGRIDSAWVGMTPRESVEAAIDYSHKKASYHQRKADEELAEVTRLHEVLAKLKECEKHDDDKISGIDEA